MNRRIFNDFSFLIFFALGVFLPWRQINAKNQALVVGGACETEWKEDRFCDRRTDGPYCEPVTANSGGGLPVPKMDGVPLDKRGRKNIFSSDFDLAAKTLVEKNGWPNTKFLFSDDKWKKRPTGKETTPILTKESMFKAIDDAKNNLSKTPNNQFLLAIDTHGSAPPAHGVCMSDGSLVSMNEIKEKLQQLKDKGIKVAVIDSSCYSGSTAEIFNNSGMCGVGSTGYQVTGVADEARGNTLTNILGLALPIHTDIAKPKGYYHPVGNANLNNDQNISLSEAHRFNRLRAHPESYTMSRISECSLGRMNVNGRDKQAEESVGHLLDTCSNYFNVAGSFTIERGQDASTGQIINGEANNAELCKVHDLANSFERFFATMQESQRASIKLQQQAMGLVAANETDLISDTKSSLKQLMKLRAKIKDLDSRLELYCVDNPWATGPNDKTTCNLPKDFLKEINNANSEAADIKTKMRNNILQLTDFACEFERLNSRNENHNTCENFQLFPSTPATAGVDQ